MIKEFDSEKYVLVIGDDVVEEGDGFEGLDPVSWWLEEAREVFQTNCCACGEDHRVTYYPLVSKLRLMPRGALEGEEIYLLAAGVCEEGERAVFVAQHERSDESED